MPFAKSSRKRRTRRIAKPAPAIRRRRVATRPTTMRRRPYGVSTRLNLPSKRATTILSYVSPFSGSSSGVTPYSQVFSANSLYDPDITGVGHQPYMFDQISALYTKNQVNACNITIEGFSNTAGTSGAMVMIYATVYSALPSNDPYVLQETNNTKRFMRYKLVSDAQNRFKLSLYVRIYEVLGISKAEYNDELYKGTNTASPTKMAFLHVIAYPPDKTSVVTMDYTCKIRYYCEFSNQAIVSQS